MTWQAAAAFLACARIGAIHSVVFAGFSAESLRDRILDCGSRVVITTDEGRRGGKSIATKAIVDAAVAKISFVEHVLVLKRTGKTVPWTQGRDKWWHEEAVKVPAYCAPEIMNSEDPLFILYVSRSFPFSLSPCLRPFADFWIDWKAQGPRSHYWWLLARCRIDSQVRLRYPPWRQICLHGRCWLDYRPYVSFFLDNPSMNVSPMYSATLFTALSPMVSPRRKELYFSHSLVLMVLP